MTEGRVAYSLQGHANLPNLHELVVSPRNGELDEQGSLMLKFISWCKSMW